MEFFGAVIGLSIVTWILLAIVLGLLFPLFWLWMVVDALLRDTVDYPAADVSVKVLWVVVMLLFQPASLIYFFMVWRPRRGQRPQVTTAVPTAAV